MGNTDNFGGTMVLPSGDLAKLRDAADTLAGSSDARTWGLRAKILTLLGEYDQANTAAIGKAEIEVDPESKTPRLDALRKAMASPEGREAIAQSHEWDEKARVLLREAEPLARLVKTQREASVIAPMTKLAEELRKADPALSRSEALRQAMRDPDIAAAYRAGQASVA